MYLIIILLILISKYFLELIVEILNLKKVSAVLPDEFVGYYDDNKYAKSQSYLKENTIFGLIEDSIGLALTIIFIIAGGFNFIDGLVRGFNLQGDILNGLLFLGVLLLISQVFSLPFSVYHTFVIEQKYGFNKTTIKTFILDFIKSLVLSAVIGSIVFAGIIWFFEKIGVNAWFYCWTGVTIFQLFLVFIAPVVIMPLFNKFNALEDGELKTAIGSYAQSQNFKLQGVFKMDGSRRSTKSNAFFTGFGKFRRIVLFDTLIEKHSVQELVSVLAHEIGHYKKKHIMKNMLISVCTTGLMFFILSLFLNNPGLFAAFKMEHKSIYASIVFFGFLYAPINMFFAIISNVISRKYEYEADAFAVQTYKNHEAFITALKKLSVNNLSNLTPHPLKVFLHYSHPPVLKRISAIRQAMPGE